MPPIKVKMRMDMAVCGAPMALNLPRGIKLQLNNNNNNNNETNFAKNIKLCNGIYKPECWYKIGIT